MSGFDELVCFESGVVGFEYVGTGEYDTSVLADHAAAAADHAAALLTKT